MEYRGYEVNFVQNFTDIDDKMINKANEEHTTVKEIGDKYIDEYYKDADGLNIKRATTNPRATEYISEIIEFVSGLIEKVMLMKLMVMYTLELRSLKVMDSL